MTIGPFPRISVLGTIHNADLVVPVSQPATALLPQLLGLLGEGRGSQGIYALATALGEPIDMQRSVGEFGLHDDTILRLSRETETPPVSVISDPVDATAEHEATGKWTEVSRDWVLGAYSALTMLTAFVILLQVRGADTLEISIAAGGLCVISTLCRLLHEDLAWTYFAAADILGFWRAWQQFLAGWSPLLILLIWLTAQLTTLAIHTPQRFAHLAGLAVLAVATGAWQLIHFLVNDLVRAGTMTTTLAFLLLSLAPWLALSVVGVLKADDTVDRGTHLALSGVAGRLDRARQVLSVAVALFALLWALGMSPVARAATGNMWTLGMTIALIVAWTLRGHHFPLVTERAAIYGATLAATTTVVWSQRETIWAPLAVVDLTLILAAVLFVRISDLAGAQLRRAATWLETLAVAATIPVLVGMFNLCFQLLEGFR